MLSMLVYFSSAQLAQSQAVAPLALLPLLHVTMVISICHPLLSVSCNDRRGEDYATTLTQALMQVLAGYSLQRFFQLPRLNSHIPMHLIPIFIPFPSHGWSYTHSHGNPMGSQSSPFPCTPLLESRIYGGLGDSCREKFIKIQHCIYNYSNCTAT